MSGNFTVTDPTVQKAIADAVQNDNLPQAYSFVYAAITTTSVDPNTGTSVTTQNPSVDPGAALWIHSNSCD